MALASAFEVPASALTPSATASVTSTEFLTDWPGAFGLFVCGLLAPIVVALTATNAAWDIATFALVIGLTLVLTFISHGGRATWLFFDRTSWIVRYPAHANGLNQLIVKASGIIRSAYVVGLIASLVTSLAILIYASELGSSLRTLLPIVFNTNLRGAVLRILDTTIQDETAANAWTANPHRGCSNEFDPRVKSRTQRKAHKEDL